MIVVDTLGEYAARGRTVVKTPLELIQAVKRRSFDVAVQFDDEGAGFDWACRVAYEVGNLTLVCEEVDFYITAAHAPRPFSRLVRYGRHRGVAMVCISRRPPDLWRNLTAQADRIFCFRTIEPRDIKYLSEFMGTDTAARLRDLKPLHFICYHNGEVTHGRVRF